MKQAGACPAAAGRPLARAAPFSGPVRAAALRPLRVVLARAVDGEPLPPLLCTLGSTRQSGGAALPAASGAAPVLLCRADRPRAAPTAICAARAHAASGAPPAACSNTTCLMHACAPTFPEDAALEARLAKLKAAKGETTDLEKRAARAERQGKPAPGARGAAAAAGWG